MDALNNTNSDFVAQTQPTQVQQETPAHAVHERRFLSGKKWLCLGIAMMGISFGINMLLWGNSDAFVGIMYALTSLGCICLIKGLMDIFN